MRLFSKKPKPGPFNPFAEGANNFSPSSPTPTPLPTNTPVVSPSNIVSIEPPGPIATSPTAEPNAQSELTQSVTPQSASPPDLQISTAPADDDAALSNPTPTDIIASPPTETVMSPPTESPAELADPVPPSPQPQDTTLQAGFAEPTLTEQQPMPAETQADINALTPDQALAEPQALEPTTTDMVSLPPLENTELTPSPVDNLIADSHSDPEITSQPSNNFFRKNLVALIIISVVVIALSVLSLVFYIKWQGEKADNLEKAGTINNLNSQLQSLQNDNTNDVNLAGELDELREEVSTLTNDKLKLEENNKTLTDQNATLQKQNDELSKQIKTAACEAMTDATEKQECLDSINTPATSTE